MFRFSLLTAAVLVLSGCAASSVSRPPTTIVIENGAGFVQHTSQGSPYQTMGDTFTATEDGYSGAFTAKITGWNHALTPTACYTITPKGPGTFAVAAGATCVAGDVESLEFADTTGKVAIEYLTP